ncbi:MAG TPA: sigma-70 family RNA polymerase sigma factor [Polyangiaceae bacterium]|nr:sigma-70 family RNA polymerase sigma factor [Polyangiaceae bacterium]
MSSPTKVAVFRSPAGPPPVEPARPVPAEDDTVHAIVEREYAAVWRFLRRLGVPDSDADDTAQRVFARVLAKRGEVQPGAERAYLMRAAFRAALEDQRSRQRARARSGSVDLEVVRSPSPQPDEAFAQRQQLELLDRALAALPTELRAVLMLFEIEGLSFTEIALALELPRGTVASRVRRARELFAEAVRRDRLRSAL